MTNEQVFSNVFIPLFPIATGILLYVFIKYADDIKWLITKIAMGVMCGFIVSIFVAFFAMVIHHEEVMLEQRQNNPRPEIQLENNCNDSNELSDREKYILYQEIKRMNGLP